MQICAYTGLLPGQTVPSYNIQFSLPGSSHVRIVVFDSKAAQVTVLLDADEPATLPGQFRSPPISWNYTDADGQRVPQGNYRIYFQAGEIVSSSDLEVD